jgi:hypothetical protein
MPKETPKRRSQEELGRLCREKVYMLLGTGFVFVAAAT